LNSEYRAIYRSPREKGAGSQGSKTAEKGVASGSWLDENPIQA
jgi:hypothetical protein